MPELKEPAYFATDLRRRFQPPGAGAAARDAAGLPRAVRAAPARAARRRGVIAVPVVAGGSRAASARSRRRRDHRDPARAGELPALAAHAAAPEPHREARSLRRAIELEPARRAGRQDPAPFGAPAGAALLRAGALHRAAAPLPRRVRPEQVLVLIYDDFRADNEGTVRRVRRFLGVDDTLPVEGARGQPDRDDALAAARRSRERRRRWTGPAARPEGRVKGVVPARRARVLRATQQRVVQGAPSRRTPS